MKDYFKELRRCLEYINAHFEEIGGNWWENESITHLKEMQKLFSQGEKEITLLLKEAKKVEKYVQEEERKRM